MVDLSAFGGRGERALRMSDNPAQPQRPSTKLRHQALHGLLLDAATEAIVSAGLAKLRARSLAEAVGCSVGAIYGVFPDLDALVLAVNGRTLDALGAALGAAGTGRTAGHHLERLALAYLDYAAAHQKRWRALFEHRMPEGQAVPEWYAERQAGLFAHVEAPLALLRPRLDTRARVLLARTVFAAVHGMIDLGLSEKVAELPRAALREQVRIVVGALAAGLKPSRP